MTAKVVAAIYINFSLPLQITKAILAIARNNFIISRNNHNYLWILSVIAMLGPRIGEDMRIKNNSNNNIMDIIFMAQVFVMSERTLIIYAY